MSQAVRIEAEVRFNPRTDMKAWARRIIYRHEHGDKSLIHIQIKYAYEALGKTENRPDAI